MSTENLAASPSSSKPQQHPEDWCISIKTVGGGFDNGDDMSNQNAKISSSGERMFSITVSPEDGVASLYQEIEGATGVKASQQRLIYRGRIINDHPPLSEDGEEEGTSTTPQDVNNVRDSNDDGAVAPSLSDATLPSTSTTTNTSHSDPRTRKIKDIAGLCDGQTIHLVKKRQTSSSETPTPTSSSNTNSGRSSSIEAAAAELLVGSSTSGSGGNGGGAFLAALLGLGSLTEEGLGTANDANETTASSTSPTVSSWRSSRRSNRRPHYRLSASDLELPDPGSMEPVRQGLMTLHTLLPHSELHRESGTSPLEANREWFRGQWLDCRDTVNQWLEATVVEILRPQDILPPSVQTSTTTASNQRRPPTVDNDPAVSANDLEGRRHLLLEPCAPGDPNELSGDLACYRPRPNNDGVQLLLIHYNGWPHRWDEWIRSDSERIRPFRTRTRHPNASSTASPTPQSVFSDAPRTNISLGDEERDRAALLPELNRTLSQVNSLLGEMVQRGQSCDNPTIAGEQPPPLRRPDEDLPWIVPQGDSEGGADDESDDADYINAEMSELEVFQPRSNIVVPIEDVNDDSGVTESSEMFSEYHTSSDANAPLPYNQRELRHLATVLDRLGRTLTDAAPHVASLAATLPEEVPPSSANVSEMSSDPVLHPAPNAPPAPLGGLLSLWSRERRRQNNNAGNAAAPPTVPTTVDPDHLDYASGLVNTIRGEIRNGPRSRSSQDDIANLLGAYLAAASLSGLLGSGEDNGDDNMAGLGRLFARGAGGGNGGTGGGIDIHIHAVVTTGGAGGTGLIGIGGGGAGAAGTAVGPPTATLGGATARNLFSNSRSPRSLLRPRNSAAVANNPVMEGDEDNDDLFSELYSENPAPVDPNSSPGASGSGSPDESPIRNVASSVSSDLSSGGTFEDRPMGSTDSTQSRSPRRISSVPRRQSSGRRPSGVFRLFRRRSRSGQNDG